MVVAQMVEQSLPILGVYGSNPVNGKIHIEHLFAANRIGKKKIKKEAEMAHFYKSAY